MRTPNAPGADALALCLDLALGGIQSVAAARENLMPLQEDYIAALELLSLVFTDYRSATGGDAVLVGGAATAIYTAGLFPSGDFDIVAAWDAEFDRAILSHGFKAEDRSGQLKIGYYHPDHPSYGFQQVSGDLFDGHADRGRLVHIQVVPQGKITLPAIEDMIADRLGQHAIASPSDDSRLRQARALFVLGQGIDPVYLQRRIIEEGGNPALLEVPPEQGMGAS